MDELDIVFIDTHHTDSAVASPVHIACAAAVRNAITEYARTDTSRELGGVLLGSLQHGAQSLVQVTAMIPARHTLAGNASITFTHETWQDILEVMDSDYPNLKIIGWFHTHPGFGIFLSTFDLHIHEHFFNLPWQVAYVVDPLAHTEGFFRWEGDVIQQTKAWEVIDETSPVSAVTPQACGRKYVKTNWRTVAILGILAGVVVSFFYRKRK